MDVQQIFEVRVADRLYLSLSQPRNMNKPNSSVNRKFSWRVFGNFFPKLITDLQNFVQIWFYGRKKNEKVSSQNVVQILTWQAEKKQQKIQVYIRSWQTVEFYFFSGWGEGEDISRYPPIYATETKIYDSPNILLFKFQQKNEYSNFSA